MRNKIIRMKILPSDDLSNKKTIIRTIKNTLMVAKNRIRQD